MSATPFGRRVVTVTGVDELGPYRVLRVADPDGPEPVPGQFAMIAAAERWGGGVDERPYLPRAFSVARVAAGEAHFLLEDVGPGSRRLCELGAGDAVWLLGPLGHGFDISQADDRRAILVGGGAGIAPLAILQDRLGADGGAPRPTVLLGFRDAGHAAGAALLEDATVVTQDGSGQRGGLVTEPLVAELDADDNARVYACGPAGMLEAVRALCAERSVPAQLALEAPMACGFGACYGCVVATRTGAYARLCIDGPVLDAELLDAVPEHAGAPA